MGKAFVFGDNIDTDLILPGQYLSCSEPAELASVCMSGLEEGFARKIAAGDVFVAGGNFGCGSSREHAPVSIKAAGVTCVIARSFARIFYRNAINIGLPVLESPAAVDGIRPGDAVEVEFERGTIRNVTRGESYRFAPFTPLILEVIAAGGMAGYVRKRKDANEKNRQKGAK